MYMTPMYIYTHITAASDTALANPRSASAGRPNQSGSSTSSDRAMMPSSEGDDIRAVGDVVTVLASERLSR